MVDLSNPVTDAFYLLVMVILYLGIREVLRYRVAMKQKEITQQMQTSKKINIDGAIDGAIAAIPEIERALAQQKAAFSSMKPPPSVEDQQKILKPIEDRLNTAKMIRDNEWLVRIVAPYADNLLKGLTKMLK